MGIFGSKKNNPTQSPEYKAGFMSGMDFRGSGFSSFEYVTDSSGDVFVEVSMDGTPRFQMPLSGGAFDFQGDEERVGEYMRGFRHGSTDA